MTSHLDVVDKWTGDPLASLPIATPADIDETLSRAEHAFRTPWPAQERTAVFRRLLTAIDDAHADLSATMIRETGFVRKDVDNEIARAKVTVELCAEECRRLTGETVDLASSSGFEERLAFTIRVPRGVVLAITPFNTPFNGVIHKVGPALAAGNTVVLKPHEATPHTATRAVTMLHEAGVPPERLQVLHGGESVALPLLRDPRVAFTSFTGSTRVGTIVKQETGHRPVALELGSIASTLVCADADLERAATEIVRGGYRKAGQVCTSVQRVLADEEVADELTTRLVEQVTALRAGDPHADGTDVGPVISEAASTRIEKLVTDTVAAGSKIAVGGSRSGNVVQPTLLTDVDEDHPFSREEIFGPVVGITRTTSLDDAIRRANLSPYGLQAGVFTSSIATAMKVSEQLNAGGIVVNGTSSTRADGMPFGGQKASGFGKEGPRYAIREMTVERLVVLSP